MWHQKAKGPPDGPPVFLIFVEKLNCPQSQAYQSISPVGTGLSLTDRALGVSLGTSIGNYSPLIAPQPVKLKIHRWRHRAGSSPATGTSGKLPLPSRAPHVVGCVFFFAALVAGSYFVISARSAPPGQAANFTFVECVPFLPAFPIGGYSASLTPAEPGSAGSKRFPMFLSWYGWDRSFPTARYWR